ncbi:hypothetical protein GA0115257_10373 [Streptomyces sp. LcepLS]|nr:hypothetical protein GA0115257_10373 [Streptomyces sp. LcepLS]
MVAPSPLHSRRSVRRPGGAGNEKDPSRVREVCARVRGSVAVTAKVWIAGQRPRRTGALRPIIMARTSMEAVCHSGGRGWRGCLRMRAEGGAGGVGPGRMDHLGGGRTLHLGGGWAPDGPNGRGGRGVPGGGGSRAVRRQFRGGAVRRRFRVPGEFRSSRIPGPGSPPGCRAAHGKPSNPRVADRPPSCRTIPEKPGRWVRVRPVPYGARGPSPGGGRVWGRRGSGPGRGSRASSRTRRARPPRSPRRTRRNRSPRPRP